MTQSLGCSSYRSLPRINRRQALQVGMLGGLGMTLPNLLRARASESAPTAKAKSVILLWMQGGVSHHDSFDPKPDAPSEIAGPFRPIQTRLPGVQFSEHLPLMANMTDDLAIIRSVTHREAAHERGSMYMVEGRRPGPNTGVSRSGNPQLGCMVASVLGMRAGVPAFVSNPGNDFTSGFTGSGWLPNSTAPFRGMDVNILRPQNRSDATALQRRGELIGRVTANFNDERAGNWDQFQHQAMDILSSACAADAFDISREPAHVQQLYGIGRRNTDRSPELALAARRLVEAGVRFVTVGRDSWDHHENIFPQLQNRLPLLDSTFSGLVRDLKQRGMLDETLVVYLTEYGRTPRINDKAGRDHWPSAFSVAFAGAGIRTGQVIGMSDRQGAEVRDHPVSPEQIAATILHLVGIDPHTVVNRTDGRPIALIEGGAPIRTLLA